MRRKFVVFCVVLCGFSAVRAQGISGLPAPQPKGHVSYAAEVVEVQAGKPSVVELRFRVDDGFHVNSHTPASDLLIPTVLTMNATGPKVSGEEYPKGTAFKLKVGEGETLDVYQGEFRVRLTVVAPKGESTLTGALRYQACDNASCFPPRTLPVSVVLKAR